MKRRFSTSRSFSLNGVFEVEIKFLSGEIGNAHVCSWIPPISHACPLSIHNESFGWLKPVLTMSPKRFGFTETFRKNVQSPLHSQTAVSFGTKHAKTLGADLREDSFGAQSVSMIYSSCTSDPVQSGWGAWSRRPAGVPGLFSLVSFLTVPS